MTTQTLLLEWLEKFQKEHIKVRTYNRYQGLIEMHIVPALGDQDISSLSRREIQNFLINQKKDGNMRSKETLSATSTNMMLSLTLLLSMPVIWNTSKKTRVSEFAVREPIQRK